MVEQRKHYYQQLAGRGIVALVMAYTLTLGGTFNGIIIAQLQVISLAVLTVGVILWQIMVWRGPRLQPRTALDPALALWGITYGISALGHPSGRVAIGLWYAGFYLGIWLFLSDLRQRGMPGHWLTDAALFTAIPLIILAWLQALPWFPQWLMADVRVAFVPPRPPSALGNSNAFGTVLASLVPLGIARARWSLRRPDRILSWVWVVAALITVYLTYSRGAWLATAIALLTFGVLALKRHHSRIWRVARRRIVFLTVSAVIIASASIIAALSAFDTPRRGTSERFEFYEVAWHTFREHPLSGTGPFTFGLRLLERRSTPPAQPHNHAHNLPLNLAAELGLPGLFALAVTIGLMGWHLRGAPRHAPDAASWWRKAGGTAALAGFGAHSLVDMTMMEPALMLLMISILAASLDPPMRLLTTRRLPRLIPLGIWIVVLCSGWWSAQVYREYEQGQRQIVAGDYQRAVETLRHAANTQPFIALYHAEYGYACGLAAFHGDNSRLDACITAYERALDMEKPHAVWWANLAALRWQAGDRSLAIEAMRQATIFASDYPDFWLNLGIVYEETNQPNLAQTAYVRALETDPLWGHSTFWTETPLRRQTRAAHPAQPTPYTQALTLQQAGNLDAGVSLLKASIDRDPTQPQPYLDIARLYLASGQLPRAQDYLNAAKLLNHNDIDQARWYVVAASIADDPANDLNHARELVLPDATGIPLFHYGRNIAYFHFLRVKVKGTLLPQLRILGPDPILVEALR